MSTEDVASKNSLAYRLWQPTTANWFFSIFGAALVYAIIRYHVAGNVPLAHFPLFILNKATSLAAVGFIASSYLIGKIIHWHDHDKRLRLVVIKFCGLVGFFMAAIHAFFSMALLSPAYYGKYFAVDGRLTFQGELGLTVGVLALFILVAPAISTLPMMARSIGGARWKRSMRMGYVALSLVAAHLVVLGIVGWLAPRGWQWGIPPISLVAVTIAVIPLFVKKKLEHEKHLQEMEREENIAGERR